ncbi:MAG: ADP compounds hydrolase NudE [Methylomicrobium sp.]|nr:ADP compounds hydrolase NudE [Methylomicrobium sp.]
MPKKPTLLNSCIVAQTRLFRIESLDLIFSNGEQRNYERLARGGTDAAVLIVPMIDKETVLLIREYAAGVHRYELGLPKGKADPGETFMEAANRELKEEIGFGARHLHHLTSFSLAPSYLEHMTEILVAQDLYHEKLVGDEPEELEVVPWNINDISGLVATGECTEARSIAALYLALNYLNN